MTRCLILFAGLVLLATACGQPLTPSKTTEVYVRELGSDTPLAQAQVIVVLNDRSATPAGDTDASGRWSFTAQSDIGYTAVVSKFGYRSQFVTVAKVGDAPTLTIRLARSGT